MIGTRGPAELSAFIQERRINAEIVPMELGTPTVAAAATALGVSVSQIIKTVVFLVKNEPVLVIASGDAIIDRRPIADAYGVGKKQVKLADRETVLEITGYSAGGVPPFGHVAALPTLIDWRVRDLEVVYGGGGDDRTLLRLNPDELARASGGKWIMLSS